MIVKYYIKAYFGSWKEVSKAAAEAYISKLLGRVCMPLTDQKKKAIIKAHLKEVIE